MSPRTTPTKTFSTGISPLRITPPTPLPQFITRQELLNRLERQKARLTIITAPTGFGKTALAAQWIGKNLENGIWYSVAAEHTPQDSFEHLITGIRRIIPGFAPWAEEVVRAEFDFGRAITRMANDLSATKRNFSVVIDQSDKFTSDHTTGMQNFINSASTNIQILSLRNIGSALELTRLDNEQQLLSLNAQDLKFTEEEKNLVALAHNLDLEDPKVRRIIHESDGWPAGLQILAKAIADYGISQVLQNEELINSENKVVVKYAVDNLATEDFEILQAICFIDEISEEEIIELTGSSTGARSVQLLSNAGIYVTQTSDIPYRYRINEFIKFEVRSRLDRDQTRLQSLARKSAEISARNGHFIEAIESLEYAGLASEASEIVAANLNSILYSGDKRVVARWLPRLRTIRKWSPEESSIVNLHSLLSLGEYEIADIELLEFKNTVDQRYQFDIDLVESLLAFNRGDFKSAQKLSKNGAQLPVIRGMKNDFRHLAAMRVSVSAEFLSGRFHQTRQAIDIAIERAAQMNDPIVQEFLIPGARALYAFASGNYKDAERYARLSIRAAKDLQISGANLPFESAYVLADVLLEFGREEESLSIIREYLSAAIEAKQWPWVIALHARAALVRLQQGKINEALSLVRQGREFAHSPLIDSQIGYTMDISEVLIRLAMGDTQRIGELISRSPEGTFYQTLKIGLQAQSDPQGARKAAEKMPEGGDHERFGKEIMFALLNIANPPAAKSHLERAIEIAIPNGYFRAFVNLPDQLKSYILEIAEKKSTVYLESLSTAIRSQMMARSASGEGLSYSLTKRELEILRRLATGLTISEIAKSINISQNTIKTHLKNLYRKLNVESRSEAIKVGEELLLM